MSEACCGPGPGPPPPTGAAPPAPLWRLREIRLAALSGVALAAGLGADLAGADRAALALVGLALVAGGLTFVPRAVRGAARGRLGVDTLMAVAAVGAVVLGETGEAATLAFLFSISEALEGYALSRARRGLRALLELAPARAMVRRGGRELTVAPSDLVVGDLMVVRPGERLATDGVIAAGRSAVDLSAITGESLPVERGPGDEVLAGAINGGAALEVRVTARAADNSLARLVRIVEEAQERKGRSQRLAERVARPLVPGVMIVALAIALVGSLLGDPSTWVPRALVVLVAAAPCALAISVPVTVVAAVGAATRSGVLIKGGAALEALGRVGTVALDKTGTLTLNRPRVVEVATAGPAPGAEVLRVAAALERRSEHPLAAAILAAGPEGPAADGVEAIPGQGLVGRLGGARLRLGRPGFVEAGLLAADVERLQADGATVVLVERDDVVLGAVAVRDALRAEAPAAIGALHRQGLRTALLTGDNAVAAAAVARRAGIDEVAAELRPEDKVAAVERLRAERPTAMVGDGINDAPALASADVGIAMGAAGTDVAIEAADVALMGEDLRHLPDALAHARRAGRIMRQNLAVSGAILVALVPVAATGLMGLAAVVAVHELAEVLVIANGIRAGRRRSAPMAPLPPARPVRAPVRERVASGPR